MNIAALKEQARALERRGDTAAALDVYERILAQLDTTSVEPEAPLFVKMGDLSLRTGRAAAAIEMFERAARRYAELGSHRSVIALCVKILRTDSSRTDTYFTFARVMLEHDQVEPARLVLLDYAERARMRKTLSKLRDLESAPDATLKPMLERLLEVADRCIGSTPSAASPQAGATEIGSGAPRAPERERSPQPSVAFNHGPATTSETPPAAPPEPARPLRDTSVFEAISLPEPEPARPLRDTSVFEATSLPEEEPAPPLRDTSVFEAISLPEPESPPQRAPVPPSPEQTTSDRATPPLPAAVPPRDTEEEKQEQQEEEQQREEESEAAAPIMLDQATPETVATVTSAVQEEPSVPRRRWSGVSRRNRSARPSWALPALAAAAVAVFGVSLLALGAFSSRGELGAEPPRSASEPRTAAQGNPSAAPSTPGALASDSGSVALDFTIGGFNAIEGRIEEPDVEPVPLDQRALATATEAVKAVDAGSIDAPSVDFVTEAGRITSDPAALASRERPRAAAAAQPTRGPDIVIEGLEVEGVARSSENYQIVQRLPSGGRVTLTVEPFTRAPAGETGVLSVQAVGADSAQGTVRFGEFFVTAQGSVTPYELGLLLDRLVERSE
jgi:hypothetical protein